jgi:hypothetical protein
MNALDPSESTSGFSAAMRADDQPYVSADSAVVQYLAGKTSVDIVSAATTDADGGLVQANNPAATANAVSGRRALKRDMILA